MYIYIIKNNLKATTYIEYRNITQTAPIVKWYHGTLPRCRRRFDSALGQLRVIISADLAQLAERWSYKQTLS